MIAKNNNAPVIFLNNAGASLIPAKTRQIIQDHMDLEAQVGGYEAQRLKSDEIEKVYQTLATFLNCSTDEVALMENATAAWCVALETIPFEQEDEIIIAESEYASNYLMFLHLQKDRDINLKVIPNNEKGVICLKTLEKAINQKTRLINIVHVPTNSGRINPVEAIGQIKRPEQCFYMVDACQSVGQIPVDVAKINCDFLSATSRKYIRGPRGVGFLYVRHNRIQDLHPRLIDLSSAVLNSSNDYELVKNARRFENSERNIANVLGFGKSLEIALDYGLEQIYQTNKKLSSYLRDKLSKIKGVEIHADCPDQCAIVSFFAASLPSEQIIRKLRDKNIIVKLVKPSGAILESEKKSLPDLVRVSIHYETTYKEIDVFIQTLQEILKKTSL